MPWNRDPNETARPGPEYGPPLQERAPENPPPAPPQSAAAQKTGRPLRIAAVALALALLFFLGLLCVGVFSLGSTLSALFSPMGQGAALRSNTFAVLQVQGTIQGSGSTPLGVGETGYYHGETLAYIDALIEQESNGGILLYMNTGGGNVYESDELYRALLRYREETGRPIWAYMAGACASGGYYVASAADHLVADRNTTTGSIGVYIAHTDLSGLYEKLGIETVLVSSGAYKGSGIAGVPITEEQRAVYQETVDEMYERFIDVVADGRGLEREAVYALADGRTFSGTQALEKGLVDEVGEWSDCREAFEEETGMEGYSPNFSNATPLSSLLSSLQALLPKSDTEASLEAAAEQRSGVPMYYYSL